MALLGALAKFGMGMLHGDGNTRQCMATAVVAYKQSFGFDAPPYTYAGLRRVRRDRARRLATSASPTRSCGSASCGTRNQPEIIVIDPRAHRDRDGGHAAPRRSRRRATSTLLYGLAQLLIDARLDRPATSSPRTPTGFDEFAAFVDALHARARRRGDRLERRSSSSAWPQTIHDGKRVSFWWTMGVNQSHEGVRTAQAIINLALMTGNIGRPGTGANSITGQCNAMGSRLFSNTTNLLGGHDFAERRASRKGRRRARHRRGARSRSRSQLGLRPDHRRHRRRQDQGPVGRRHQPGALVDQPERPATSCSTGSTSSSCRTCTHTTETAQLRRPRAAGRRLGREGRARSSTPSGASGSSQRGGARPGRGARRLPHLPGRRRRAGAAASMFRQLDRPRGGVRDPPAS